MSEDAGYAVGWGALALINAGLAQGKGRSGLVWFLVSLPLGPVATLLIVVLAPAFVHDEDIYALETDEPFTPGDHRSARPPTA